MTVKVSQTEAAINGVSTNDTFYLQFENGGSADMAVDGSVITVRDDLTSIPYFKVSCHGVIYENN